VLGLNTTTPHCETTTGKLRNTAYNMYQWMMRFCIIVIRARHFRSEPLSWLKIFDFCCRVVQLPVFCLSLNSSPSELWRRRRFYAPFAARRFLSALVVGCTSDGASAGKLAERRRLAFARETASWVGPQRRRDWVDRDRERKEGKRWWWCVLSDMARSARSTRDCSALAERCSLAVRYD